MKKLLLALAASSGLLAGCAVEVVRDDGYRGQRYYDNESYTYYGNRRDRDGDGVSNSRDRRPDDPRRY